MYHVQRPSRVEVKSTTCGFHERHPGRPFPGCTCSGSLVEIPESEDQRRDALGRKRPYTERGISRVPCARCGEASAYQWQVCANDNRWMGVCARCDVALNALVLRWFRMPDWRQKIEKYAGFREGLWLNTRS